MRLILFGATGVSRAVADRILGLGVELVGVVYGAPSFSISYRPQGVTNVRYADMGAWAESHGIPARLHADVDDTVAFCAPLNPDLGLVAGWYHLLPRKLREVFGKGCVGAHASLLPKFRGGAPLNWALHAGETETGVTLFQLDGGVDAGPIYAQRSFPIGPRAEIGELVTAADQAILELVTDVLPKIADGTIEPVPQTGEPSYSLMRFPEDGIVDWRQPAVHLDRLVRSVSRPYPGAWATMGDDELVIWRAEPLHSPVVYGVAGQIARLPGEPDPCVVTGEGSLVLREVTDRAGADALDRVRRAAHRRFALFPGAHQPR